MIDLHSHTTYSDGTWSVKELLEKAEEKKIEILSITDHDTAKAHVELRENPELRDIFSGKIKIGAELNCAFDGKRIEALAYDFDLAKVQEWLENRYSKEKVNERLVEEFNDFCDICKRKGVRIEENLKYNPNTEYPVDVIYDSIKKFDENKDKFTKEQWEDSGVFFRTCTIDPNFILYRDFSKQEVPLEKITNLIHENGGKVFIAHLFKYKIDEPMKLLDKMVKQNLLDGVEVYHSSFNEEQMELLKKYCEDNNLLMSGGSDCHGERKPGRKLGVGYDNLNISKDIINNW